LQVLENTLQQAAADRFLAVGRQGRLLSGIRGQVKEFFAVKIKVDD